ncbi:MAG: glycosyltransferase family 4 protein [Candidatus Promineifilaceae bacterium]
MTKTILYLDHAPVWGGAEAVLVNLITHLDHSRFHPVVGTAVGSPLAERLQKMGLPCHLLPFATLNRARWRLPVHLVQSVTAVSRLVRQTNAAIIHTNTVRAHIAGTLAGWLTHTPVIWTIHDNTFPPHLVRLLATIPYRTVAVSGWLRDLYQPYGLAGKCVVIPNGLPVPQQPPAPLLLSELGLPPDTRLVTAVGRVIPGKGAHHFIEAANRLASTNPQAAFVLVGGKEEAHTDYAQNIHRKITTSPLNNKLQWVGHRRDVARFLAETAVFVYPATQPEGLPTVLLEAMSQGKAVVASATGGALEIVQPGVTGLLVPPGDSDALAAAIEELLTNEALAGKMGAAGQARWRQNFSVESQVAQMMGLYEGLMVD